MFSSESGGGLSSSLNSIHQFNGQLSIPVVMWNAMCVMNFSNMANNHHSSWVLRKRLQNL